MRKLVKLASACSEAEKIKEVAGMWGCDKITAVQQQTTLTLQVRYESRTRFKHRACRVEMVFSFTTYCGTFGLSFYGHRMATQDLE